MAFDENTSPTIGKIAAAYAHHPDPNVRRMSMSLLTQVLDHKAPEVRRLLDELTALCGGKCRPFSNADYEAALQMAVRVARRAAFPRGVLASTAPINALTRGNRLLSLARRYPAEDTIAGGGGR